MKRTVPTGLAILSVGCAALNLGWYKPGVSQQDFAQDRYECMASSQMNVSQAAVEKYEAAQSSHYQPTSRASYEPSQSGKSSASGDAYYDCMKKHQWADS